MVAAFLDGVRRVNRAPAVLVGLWLSTLVLATPLTLAVRGAIVEHLGASLEADSAASGVNYDWMQEFAAQSTGLATTVKPTVIGFGAVVGNLSSLLDGDAAPVLVTSAAAVYLGVLLLASSGIIDRLARDRATKAHGFFGACGGFFARFIRLGLLSAAAYGLLLGPFHSWLFDDIYPQLTRDMTAEREAFLVRLALYVALIFPLAACNLLFDYAKVRAVVEDRRSMVGAVAAAAGFIRRNVASVVAVYGLNVLALVLLLLAYALAAPGAGTTGWSMWMAFVLGQLFIVARLWAKLVAWASEASLFQSRLAHAGYVRHRARTWPESAGAETLG